MSLCISCSKPAMEFFDECAWCYYQRTGIDKGMTVKECASLAQQEV